MIVLDEQLDDPRIVEAIEKWYKGSVITIGDIRPNTIIKDDGIASLLHQLKQPTLVTINVKDFWKVIPPSDAYCIIICFKFPAERSLDIPDALRTVLGAPQLKTKKNRMGLVVLISPTGAISEIQSVR